MVSRKGHTYGKDAPKQNQNTWKEETQKTIEEVEGSI